MIDSPRYRVPIRVRLTLWYVFLLAITFSAFAVYLIYRFRYSLIDSLDASLHITVTKTIAALDPEDFAEIQRLSFDTVRRTQVPTSEFAMRLVSVQGLVWDTYGAVQKMTIWGPIEEGITTQPQPGEESGWRIFSQPVSDSNGQMIGWVQASRSLGPVNEAVDDLRDQLLFGIPLMLLFAGFGGYFLADRALQPIEQITITAQEITARDLSRRLGYRGSEDEVGKLARTFDHMLERLQSAFQREQRFTADAAHELRTPLTALKGQIEVTLNRSRQPSEYEAKLRDLSSEVNRLIRLSNALLFLSRSDQNQIFFNQTRVDLKEILEGLIEQIRPLADEKKIRLNIDLQDDLRMSGDYDHLVRLFMNLFENALKYTPSAGEISVNAKRAGDFFEVLIRNSGSEIPSEHLQHIFKRFYRVDADRSTQSGGSGLGLAIAEEIVHLHNGIIAAQNDAGNGVTFTVSLPGITR